MDPLGVGAGKLVELEDPNMSNSYTTIPDQSLDGIADRVQPRQVSSGVTRGTQTYSGTDGSFLTLGVVDSSDQIAEAQYSKTGKKVSQLGQQADGSSGLKFFDVNGIGTALFGTYPDGSTALKVAKPGIEVGSATNDQLVFNSGQNVFKIIDKKTSSIPSFSIAGGASTKYSLLTIPHNQSFTPIVNAYVSGIIVNFNTLADLAATYVPLPIFANGSVNSYYFRGADGAEYPLTILIGVDATNIYIQASTGSAAATTINAIPLTYYIMQETAQ